MVGAGDAHSIPAEGMNKFAALKRKAPSLSTQTFLAGWVTKVQHLS